MGRGEMSGSFLPKRNGPDVRERLSTGGVLDISGLHMDGATAEDIAEPVEKAVAQADREQRRDDIRRVAERNMVKPNTSMKVKVVIHQHQGPSRNFLFTVAHSIRYVDFDQAIVARCGDALPATHGYYWVDERNDVVPLDNQPDLTQFVFTMWCAQPWVIHAIDTSGKPENSAAYESLINSVRLFACEKAARLLFQRFDVNQNGRIERRELF